MAADPLKLTFSAAADPAVLRSWVKNPACRELSRAPVRQRALRL